MPRPKLLSIESKADYRVDSAGGWWNGVGDKDHAEALNRWTSSARDAIGTQQFLDEAKRNLDDSMERIVKSRLGKDTRVIYVQ
jgi:hypothetical protein